MCPDSPGGVHDKDRPEPWVITPPTASTQAKAGSAPSDATVLFNGTDLSQWQADNGKDAQWTVKDGYMEVNGTGSIKTRESFGSCQLHVEFASPMEIQGDSQKRGNSGVMIMGLYEIQVLDSYENRSYSDGQAAAIYGQYPPLVNTAHQGNGKCTTLCSKPHLLMKTALSLNRLILPFFTTELSCIIKLLVWDRLP